MTDTQTIELPPIANLDVPAAWAPAEQRDLIKDILQDMLANGWSRPMISALTAFSDSQVYRAKEGAAHTVEVDRWNAFLQGVKDGTFKPTVKARKLKADQVLAGLRTAVAQLASAQELRTAKEVKEQIAIFLAALPEALQPEADEPAAEAEAEAEAEVPAQSDAQD